jgi:hypothetical protein
MVPGLTEEKGLSAGTAVRHTNVMHHMMEKAPAIWSKETNIDRNPADQVEVYRPDDQRERYLSAEEISSLKCSLDKKMFRDDMREINRTFSLPYRQMSDKGIVFELLSASARAGVVSHFPPMPVCSAGNRGNVTRERGTSEEFVGPRCLADLEIPPSQPTRSI